MRFVYLVNPKNNVYMYIRQCDDKQVKGQKQEEILEVRVHFFLRPRRPPLPRPGFRPGFLRSLGASILE